MQATFRLLVAADTRHVATGAWEGHLPRNLFFATPQSSIAPIIVAGCDNADNNVYMSADVQNMAYVSTGVFQSASGHAEELGHCDVDCSISR